MREHAATAAAITFGQSMVGANGPVDRLVDFPSSELLLVLVGRSRVASESESGNGKHLIRSIFPLLSVYFVRNRIVEPGPPSRCVPSHAVVPEKVCVAWPDERHRFGWVLNVRIGVL